MGTENRNVLCRYCYELFRYEQIGAHCRSRQCDQVPNDQDIEGPRYFDPRTYGLWKGRRRPKLDLGPETKCPFCNTTGSLVPACPVCRHDLDRTVGQVEDHVIGVIGASDSGKSHFLAAVLHQFLEARIGGDLWEVEFASREDRRIYRQKFLIPFFEERRELQSTPASSRQELKLLLENKNTSQKVLLVFRDLGGELFTNTARLDEEDFLRYADGIVLVTDPLAFTPRETKGIRLWSPTGMPTAVEVLETYREVLEARERPPRHEAFPLLPEEKFLAVAVTKSDVVMAGDDALWPVGSDSQHLEPGFAENRTADNEAARDWVRRYLGSELTHVADDFADVSYFLVSSFGYRHTPKTPLRKKPSPKRVHEPIFALLDRFSQARGGRRRSVVDLEDEL